MGRGAVVLEEIDRVVRDFAIEARDSLDHMENALVSLEVDGADLERIALVMRVLHTIKGTCGYFDFPALGRLCHAGEHLMSPLREGQLGLTEDGASVLFDLLDSLRDHMDSIEETGEESATDDAELVDHLMTLGAVPDVLPVVAPQSDAPRMDAVCLLDEDDAEILQEFFAETGEGLDAVEEALVALEQNPGDADRLDLVFRVVHTIKGTCSFFAFARLERLAHTGESLLADLRKGIYQVTPALTSILLELLDALRVAVATIEQTASDVGLDFARLCERMNHLRETGGSIYDTDGIPSPAVPMEVTPRAAERPHSSIRVATPALDELAALAGELASTRDHLLDHAAHAGDPELAALGQRLDDVSSRLHEAVAKTRIQPVRSVFKHLPRLVRDVARACDKRVTLTVEGAETELDRSVVDAIRDPLTHIVRNGVDHGIEPAAERRQLGKPEAGNIQVTAHESGGFVVIEIHDDGAGIDIEKLKAKATSTGRISADEAASMNARSALSLIFVPGLSTADHLTPVSGRGVGMDVVRSKVELHGGAVEVSTERGAGTRFTLKIPL